MPGWHAYDPSRRRHEIPQGLLVGPVRHWPACSGTDQIRAEIHAKGSA